MDRDTLLTLSLALCCVFALGTAATALESSVSTEPGDLVDLDYESLPISTGEAEELREQYEEGPDESSANEGTDGTTESLLDRLLGLLAALFDLLVQAVPALLVLAALAVAIRRRQALLDRVRGGDSETQSTAPQTLAEGDPDDDISRTWYEMIRRLDLEERREKTPREFESEAVDRAADPAAVTDLTRTFEDVRYGEYEPTEDRSQRVRDALERVLGRRSTRNTDGWDGETNRREADSNRGDDHAVRSDGGDRR